jgi:hypothetical protein
MRGGLSESGVGEAGAGDWSVEKWGVAGSKVGKMRNGTPWCRAPSVLRVYAARGGRGGHMLLLQLLWSAMDGLPK